MAGRKEYELLFKLQAALGGNFNTVFQSALNTTKQMQNSLTKLNSITGKIDAYKKQEAALESNRQKLERLTAEHDKLYAYTRERAFQIVGGLSCVFSTDIYGMWIQFC